MTADLTWIPVDDCTKLRGGYYWLRDRMGVEYVQRIEVTMLQGWMWEHITHYCPVPKPQRLQEDQEGP